MVNATVVYLGSQIGEALEDRLPEPGRRGLDVVAPEARARDAVGRDVLDQLVVRHQGPQRGLPVIVYG